MAGAVMAVAVVTEAWRPSARGIPELHLVVRALAGPGAPDVRGLCPAGVVHMDDAARGGPEVWQVWPWCQACVTWLTMPPLGWWDG